MRAGSTLVGFEVKGGKAGAFRFLNGLKISRISNNLGDSKSLVTHPATTTHQRLAPEARAELGISEGFVRFSAGLEHPDDLIEDLDAALERACGEWANSERQIANLTNRTSPHTNLTTTGKSARWQEH